MDAGRFAGSGRLFIIAHHDLYVIVISAPKCSCREEICLVSPNALVNSADCGGVDCVWLLGD